jgi:hypothetical protein
MGDILYTEDIFPTIIKELENANSELIVISAFVKTSALRKIDEALNKKKVSKKILIRFRLDDIIKQSTDFSILEYCFQNEWKVSINFDLHSKILIFDRVKFLLGSANMTLSGLGISNTPNIESMYLGNFDNTQYNKVEELFKSSLEVDSHLYNEMKVQFDGINHTEGNSENIKWDQTILNEFIKQTDYSRLWCSEMISSSSPYDLYYKDAQLLGLRKGDIGNIDLIREKFTSLKFFKWFSNSFENEIYFGRLSALLHDTLIDDPAPYRKNVKEYLANFINWIIELEVEGVIIDKPRYSTRIRKTKKC